MSVQTEVNQNCALGRFKPRAADLGACDFAVSHLTKFLVKRGYAFCLGSQFPIS